MRLSVLWTTSLIALWLVLTQASLASWVIGIPFILLALVVCVQCFSSGDQQQIQAINIHGVLRFILYFVWESIRGGIDVVRVVMSAKPGLDSQFFDYQISLQNSIARQFFISSISLLPGTLSADWNADTARIHALDLNTDTSNGVKILEQKIADIFGEQLC